jgi:CRISPR-associated protein Cmr4
MTKTKDNQPNSLLFFIMARTPLHVGCGQGMDDIDLPIYRSKATQLPVLPSSSIKGVMRQFAPSAWQCNDDEVTVLFGPERDSASLHAGMLTPQDARLLAMPVASMQGGWAWVTSREALRCFKRDAESAGVQKVPDLPAALPRGDGMAHVGNRSPLHVEIGIDKMVVLAEHVLTPAPIADSNAKSNVNANEKPSPAEIWGGFLSEHAFPGEDQDWLAAFIARLVVLPDQTFTDIAKMCTEVRTRVSLNENRVANDAALWREECMPADSLFWGVMGAQRVENSLGVTEAVALAKAQQCSMQLGGKASVGYGWIDFVPVRTISPPAPVAKVAA